MILTDGWYSDESMARGVGDAIKEDPCVGEVVLVNSDGRGFALVYEVSTDEFCFFPMHRARMARISRLA